MSGLRSRGWGMMYKQKSPGSVMAPKMPSFLIPLLTGCMESSLRNENRKDSAYRGRRAKEEASISNLSRGRRRYTPQAGRIPPCPAIRLLRLELSLGRWTRIEYKRRMADFHGKWCDGPVMGGEPMPDIEHLYELSTSRVELRRYCDRSRTYIQAHVGKLGTSLEQIQAHP